MTQLTDADLTYFWLGPLGRLRQLPLIPLGRSTTATEDLFGGLFTGIDGTATLQVLGLKRSWQLDWVCLQPSETAAVHAWFHRLNRSALRIVDPRAYNRLSRDGASGGSWSRSVTAHTVTAGTRTFAAVTDYPAGVIELVDGGVAWSVPGSTAATLRIDDTLRIPLIPGEQVNVAALVKGTLGAQVGVQFYDVAGATAGTSLATSVTLASWSWLTHTFTPTSTQVAASLVVSVASGSARTVTVGPARWHPTVTDWNPGAGCPRVLISAMATSYPGLAYQDPGITVREA